MDHRPIRIASQPILGGAIVYEAQVSPPVTLVADVQPESLDLSFALVNLTGKVEGQARGLDKHLDAWWRPGQPLMIGLIQIKDPASGEGGKIFIRCGKPKDDGTFCFDAIPPGEFELHFLVWSEPINKDINMYQRKLTIQSNSTTWVEAATALIPR